MNKLVPHTLQTNFDNGGFFNSIQTHSSSSIEGPAYYLGQRIVRPTIDGLVNVCVKIDRVLDRIVKFFPGAEAVSIKVNQKLPAFKSYARLGYDWDHPLRALFDVLVGDIQSSINDIIDKVESAEVLVIMEAAKEANVVIQNMKVTYEELLDTTVSKLDSALKSELIQLQGLVQSILLQTGDTIETFMQQADDIISRLPFADQRPRLRLTPTSLTLGRKTDFAFLKFSGSFPSVGEEGCEPEFKLNNKTYSSLNENTKAIVFRIPAADFNTLRNNSTHSYSYVKGELNVPWLDKGWFLTEKSDARFSVGFDILPNSPGNLTVKYRQNSKYINKPVVDGPHTLGVDSGVFQTLEIRADMGWTIQRNSLDCGTCHCYFQPEAYINGDVATCKYHFLKGEWGTFYVRFIEEKNDIGDEWLENLNIDWGDQIVIAAPANSTIRELHLDSFDGKYIDIVAPDYTNAYLEVSLTADSRWILKARYKPLDH